MKYVEISPSPEISPFIKCFWEYKNETGNIEHTIFPNGCFELFMIFERQKLVSIFLSGLKTKPFEVYVPQGITVSAIRFLLSASEYVLERKISSILDNILPLDIDFWGIHELSTLSFREKTNIITHKLREKIEGKEIEPSKLRLLNKVYTPDLRVEDVSKESGWNRRKINRYFNNQFGLSLKTFLSIIRLRSSFESIKDGILYPSLNYYDQSHYIKEVRKYTGTSPKDLLKNENDRFLQFSIKGKS